MKPWIPNVLAGLIITFAVIQTGCEPQTVVAFLDVQASLQPQWGEDSATETIDADTVMHEFHLLWDQSIPMGGYIHRTDPDSQGTLKSINDFLKSARLTTDYGGDESSLKCLGVTDSIVDVDCDPIMSQDFFDGSTSRLDQGIEYIIEGLINGSFKGAAFVSDLIATTVYGTGPPALLPYLRSSTLQAYLNSGTIDIALIGTKINYWGVHRGPCETLSGSLGCWYDEAQRRYKPLDQIHKSPVYILILGLRPEGKSQEDNPVFKMATELAQSMNAQSMEIKHELITQGSLGSESEFHWYPYAETGFQAIGLTDHGYQCKDIETHRVKGRFLDPEVSIAEIAMHGSLDSAVTVMTNTDDPQLVHLEINCKTLREYIRDDQSQVCNERSNRLVGTIYSQGQSHWAEWASVAHTSHLTMGLEPFIDGIRPSHYQATIESAPPLDACKTD